MSTIILVGIIDLCLMIIILVYFSADIIQEQKKMRENFIKQRKLNLYKVTLNSDPNKQLVKDINKGFFAKRRDSVERLLFKANMPITYEEYLIIGLVCAAIGWLIGDILNNMAISAILAYIMFNLPKSYMNFVCNSIKAQIADQIEPAISQIIGLLPSKKTLVNACEACIDGFEEPLKTYFTEFVNNINNANRSFEDSIEDLAKKIDTKPFYDFARIAVVHYRQGGDTMYAFNTIPETMRDIKMIQSEQESELDSLRLVGYIFVLLTPAAYGFYYLTNEDNFKILTQSFVGKTVTVIVLITSIITFKLIQKISKPVEM